jgi:hypothetical protein
MRRFLLIAALVVAGFGVIHAERTIRLADEAAILLPDNWLLGSDTVAYPVQLVFGRDGAEILVFRSVIAGDEMIVDDAGLRGSVQQVEKDVIGSLPQGRLLTSTGYYETSRAGFALEFTSFDSAGGTVLRHRLVGHIYRHPDNYQLLYTLWGKSAETLYSSVEPAIQQVQQSFRYDGDQTDTVFPTRAGKSYWMLLLLAMAVVGLFVFYGPRRRKSALPSELPDNHFWHCTCGRRNHDTQQTCLRCGRTHSQKSTV